MPEKIICPVCDQEVEVLHTPTGNEYAPHYASPSTPSLVQSVHFTPPTSWNPSPNPPPTLKVRGLQYY